MLADTTLIVREWPERPDLIIYPIFDVHLGAAECMVDEWETFLKALKAEPNSYIIIGGDMLNNGIKTSVSNCYDETMRPREQKAMLTKQLEPIRDRILCGVPGNHCGRNADVDQNPLYDVFCKLDIQERYRENAAYNVFRLGDKSANGAKNPTYTMAVLHGAGGGMYIGSAANRNERFGAVIDGLDILVTGHTHKPITYPVGKLSIDPQNNRVSHKDFRVVVATSWLDYAGYAMRKMLPPTAHCLSAIKLCGTKKQIKVEM